VSERRYDWIVYAVALLLVGGLVGYLLAVQSLRSSVPAATAAVPSTVRRRHQPPRLRRARRWPTKTS